MRSVIITLIIFMLIVNPVFAVSDFDFRIAVKKALLDYYDKPSTSVLTAAEIKDLLNAYLIAPLGSDIGLSSIGPNSGQSLDNIYNKAVNIPKEIPKCYDGTFYGECSAVNKGKQCFAGRLVDHGDCQAAVFTCPAAPPVFSSIMVTPNPAGIEHVTITFSSSAILVSNPTVLLKNRATDTVLNEAVFVSKNGLDYTYSFSVLSRYSNGLVDVVITGQTSSDPCSQGSSIGAFNIDKSLHVDPLKDNLGEQKTLVMLVNFLDNTGEPYTTTEVYDNVFGMTSDYLFEASYGKTWLSGKVVGWYTLPITTSCPFSPDQILTEALKAADGEVFFPAYSRLIVVHPWTCSTTGGGGSIMTDISTPDGNIRASKVDMNGLIGGAITHEIGHTFGLLEAGSLLCWGETIRPSILDCTIFPYGNPFDTMSNTAMGHFNAAYKEEIGWLAPNNILTLDTEGTGTYTIKPLEISTSGIQLIKIIGKFTTYYVEYRQPLGLDSFLSQGDYNADGALVNIKIGGGTKLLDMTPTTTGNFRDAALPVGQTFTDPEGLTITTKSRTASSLVIEVTIPAASKVKQITTDMATQRQPAISGDRIVWQDYRNGNWDIYLYDLATSTERQINVGFLGDEEPAISDNGIVWVETSGGFRNSRIFYYDLTTNTERQISNSADLRYGPDISGNRIVWVDGRHFNPEIYLYNLATSTEQRITTDFVDQTEPAIYGDKIVWSDYRNGNWDIYLYNIATSTEQQITTSTSSQVSPAISGDRIVWQDNRNGNWDIYLYNIATSTEQQITTSTASQTEPAISGDRIVWQDNSNGNEDIYLYDLTTGEVQHLTINIANQLNPAIMGNRIVWEDESNSDSSIYGNSDIYCLGC